jgi:hypothetical protein
MSKPAFDSPRTHLTIANYCFQKRSNPRGMFLFMNQFKTISTLFDALRAAKAASIWHHHGIVAVGAMIGLRACCGYSNSVVWGKFCTIE